MNEELLEAWNTNNRINLFLLERIPAEGLRSTLSKRGGRDVARQLAHMHNNRVAWMKKAAPSLAGGVRTFETKEEPDRAALTEALEASGSMVAGYISRVSSGALRARGHRKGLAVTVAYLIAHDSHHRGSILLTLKECGHRVDGETQYGIWDWDKR
jgi:uncharacterized damage-inducible protein DinB